MMRLKTKIGMVFCGLALALIVLIAHAGDFIIGAPPAEAHPAAPATLPHAFEQRPEHS
jgi:hypothetical protein